MAAVETALVYQLQNDSAVGAVVDARIYPLLLTQGSELPAIVYQRLSTYGEHANDTNSTLISSRIRFDCYGKTYSDAKNLAIKVKACLDGFIGLILTVHIDGILFVDEFDSYDEDAELVVIGVDFRIWSRP